MSLASILGRAKVALLALFVSLCLPLYAQNAGGPEAQLVEKIVSHTGGPASISLTVSNLSSRSPAEVDQIHRDLEKQFLLHGVRIASPEQAVVNIIITLSESARESLWLVEILEGQTRDVMIQSVSATTSAPVQVVGTSLSLQPRLVLSQDSPILDFVELPSASSPGASLSNDRQILVLSPDRLLLYAPQQGRMQALQQVELANVRLKTRDPRGRLFVHDNVFEAYLPGYRCDGAATGAISANCRQSDDPWPLLPQSTSPKAFYANARNFFTGVITAAGHDRTLPAFYNAAIQSTPDGDHFIIAGVDWRLQNESGTRFAASAQTEITSMKSDCSTAPLLIGSRASDWTRSDAVQLYTVNGADLQPTGREIELPGPVLAMWNAAPSQANISVHNLQTGAYEAYALTIACNR